MLRISNISKSFKKNLALKDISFEVNDGEVMGLIGENGAGKSTLLRILSTMLVADSGTAVIGGYDLNNDAEKVRKSVGILFGSEVGLYERLTAKENLEYFSILCGSSHEETKKRVIYLIDKFEIKSFENKFAYTLSKGMKQKVAIARAVVHNPKIMFFDEPDSGLDFVASRIFFEFLELCKREGKSIIFSSHSMENIKIYSDRIAIIRSGIIAQIINVKDYYDTHNDREFNNFLYDVICKNDAQE